MRAETHPPRPPESEVVLFLTQEEAAQLRLVMGYQMAISESLSTKWPGSFNRAKTMKFLATVGSTLEPYVTLNWWSSRGLA
jgi:hypothetical protein